MASVIKEVGGKTRKLSDINGEWRWILELLGGKTKEITSEEAFRKVNLQVDG